MSTPMWRRYLRLRGPDADADLEEEILFHLETRVEELVRAGATTEAARAEALREFGDVARVRSECRTINRGAARERQRREWLGELKQDLQYAWRQLRRSPGFAAVAVLTLALGIGANTAIFSLVDSVVLRPLPYPGSERLVVLRGQPLHAEGTISVDPASFVQWCTRARSFEALALVQAIPMNVMWRDGAEQITNLQTTSELFRVFGVSPSLGRGFTEGETRPGGDRVVMLSYGFWQRSFNGDPAVIGRSLTVPDGSLTIVGVAPAGLRIGLTEPDVYTPLRIDPADPAATGGRAFESYARLRAGIDIDAARREMTAIASDLAREYRLSEGVGVFVGNLHDYLVREARPALRLLMGVVATVLLIACVNLAGLLMARSLGRRGEFALRSSLGASRGRLVRQVIIESLVLSACGGAAGLIVAYWATGALVSLTAGTLTFGDPTPIHLDTASFLFTLGLATLAALLFGFVPAWQASRVEPHLALQDGTRGATIGRRHLRMRSILVVTEMALAIVLLVGAGLLLRTFSNLVRTDLGFQPTQTVTARLFLGVRTPEARVALVDQILERVEQVPNVRAAGTIQFLPLSGMICGTGFWFEGPGIGDPSRTSPTECALVSRGYFAAMGIPIQKGRLFGRQDRFDSPRVLLVNQSFAKRYFPRGEAVDRRILVQASDQEPAEIVGVVGDTRQDRLTSEPTPLVYLLHAQTPGYITNLVVRTTGDAVAQVAAIRRAVQEVDPTMALADIKTMEQYVGAELARPRLYAALVASFALIATLLAAIGIYGLIAFVVRQRTREIGIRMALGATREKVFAEVLRQGARLIGIGFVLGVIAAAGLRGLVSRFLFGVTPNDAVTYLLAATALLGLGLAAVMIPAHRASRVEPIDALRCE